MLRIVGERERGVRKSIVRDWRDIDRVFVRFPSLAPLNFHFFLPMAKDHSECVERGTGQAGIPVFKRVARSQCSVSRKANCPHAIPTRRVAPAKECLLHVPASFSPNARACSSHKHDSRRNSCPVVLVILAKELDEVSLFDCTPRQQRTWKRQSFAGRLSESASRNKTTDLGS